MGRGALRQFRSESIGSEVTGPKGMVTAMHPEAAREAAHVLETGGTAHDAALAALAMMAVAEPFMSGPGGHGAAVVAEPGKAPYVVDGSALGPRRAQGGAPPVRGAGSVPVPAALTAWAGLHTTGASRKLADLFGPAVAAARDGLEVAWYTALMISANGRLLQEDPSAGAIFLANRGLPPQPQVSTRAAADLLVQPDLAATLERIGTNGLDELRRGETGRRIIEVIQRAGGPLGEGDLIDLQEAVPYPTVNGTFRGRTVHTGPVASAGPSLLEMLGILEDLDAEEVPLGSARYYARIADAQRAAFLDRDHHGDPAFGPVPLAAFGDPELARIRRGDSARAKGGPLPRRALDREGYPVAPGASPSSLAEGASTTHVNVAAPDGTLISATFTLGYPFGSGLVAAGTGLFLGNTLHQFHPDRDHPNGVAPGKRAVWNGAPTIISSNGTPQIAIGAPGGVRIPGAIAQVLVAHLVYGLSPQRATEVPRLFQQGDIAYIDDRVPPQVLNELRAQGRRVEEIREGPFASNFARPGIISLAETGELHGGVDAWRLGTVVSL